MGCGVAAVGAWRVDIVSVWCVHVRVRLGGDAGEFWGGVHRGADVVSGLEGCAPGVCWGGVGGQDRTGEKSRGVEREGVGEGVDVSAAAQMRSRDISRSLSRMNLTPGEG